MTSSLCNADLKGDPFGCTIYPSSLIEIVIPLCLQSYGGGGGGGADGGNQTPSPQPQKTN